jgi:endonuclease III
MDNQTIIARIYKVQLAVRPKNGIIAAALEKVIIPLLEYNQPLAAASRQDLLNIKGVGAKTVEIILQIIAGDCIHKVAQNVPRTKIKREDEEDR